jgi:hypothetical protein
MAGEQEHGSQAGEDAKAQDDRGGDRESDGGLRENPCKSSGVGDGCEFAESTEHKRAWRQFFPPAPKSAKV